MQNYGNGFGLNAIPLNEIMHPSGYAGDKKLETTATQGCPCVSCSQEQGCKTECDTFVLWVQCGDNNSRYRRHLKEVLAKRLAE